MDLIIVRHGQSTGNITTDDVPDGELTPLGRQQAAETAARLAGEGITHVLASPLVRALATGTAIADAAGLDRLEVWPELQEHRYSMHRGLSRAELLRQSPKAVFSASVEAHGWDHGGETYETALERGVSALAMLRQRFSGRERVVVATHGAFGSFLLRAALRVPPEHSLWLRMNNCAISRVAYLTDRHASGPTEYPMAEAEIVCMNDVSHLSVVS
jgi:broad specificity phosphatase PhoE